MKKRIKRQSMGIPLTDIIEKAKCDHALIRHLSPVVTTKTGKQQTCQCVECGQVMKVAR